MRILADNFIKTATITPLTEATGYEFDTALKDTRLSRIARTTSKTYQHIDFDLLTTKSIDYCSILNHNLTDTATATIQGFTNNPITDTTEEMYLPLETDALDISGNDNDGTATDIVYTDKPDMRVFLPLISNTLDSSDFGNDGTATDITYGADGAILNGTTSNIVIPISIADITGYCAHIVFKKSSVPAENQMLFSNYQDASNRILCGINTSGYLFVMHVSGGVGSNVIIFGSLNLCDDINHRVIINFINSTSLQITVDNSDDVVATLSIALPVLSSPVFMLGSMGGGNFMSGSISNFRFFVKNLSIAEKTLLYNSNIFLPLSKKVAVFNSISSYISLGNVLDNIIGKCISIKIKENKIPGSDEFILSNYSDANNNTLIYIHTDGKIIFQNTFSGDTTYSYVSDNICDGLSHNLVINIIDSSHIQSFLDGIFVVSISLTYPLAALSSPTLRLGAWVSSGYLNGCISDFYIFNRNLTTTEISNLYTYNSFSDFADVLDCSTDVILKEFTASQTYRYWRLAISDPTNTDTYISLSKWYLGTYIQLPYMAKNQKIPTASTSDVAESNDLQAYGDPGVFYRYGTVNFPNIEDSDYTIMDSMFRLLDKYVPFILLIWENDLTFFPPLYSIMTSDFDWTRVEGVTGRKWSLAFNFKETF